MTSRRPLSVFLIAFLVGGVIGYASVSSTQPRPDGVGLQADYREDDAGPHPMRDDRAGESRSSRSRRDTASIRLDEKGRYLLPASLAERLQCMALSGMKVNRSGLAILGFSDQELDQL